MSQNSSYFYYFLARSLFFFWGLLVCPFLEDREPFAFILIFSTSNFSRWDFFEFPFYRKEVNYILPWIILIIGILIGWFLRIIFDRLTCSGDIGIQQDKSDDELYLFLTLDKDVNYILGKKYATFRIDNRNFTRK